MKIKKHNFLESVAIFSDSMLYRYFLERNFAIGKGVCHFVMLNPSTADESKNDPTVARCCSYAQQWGFSKLWVTNIFPLRSTDPKGLYDHKFAKSVLKINESFIVNLSEDADLIIVAWGNHGMYLEQGPKILAKIVEISPGRVYNLGVTKTGCPKHPLYLRKDVIRNGY